MLIMMLYYHFFLGHLVFVIADYSDSPIAKLYGRFWLKEHKWPLKFSQSITEILDSQCVKYEMTVIEGANDMTESFKDNFQKSCHKYLLDFLTHTKLDCYPPVMAQTCIDYLSSVAQGKQYKVPEPTAVIVCGNH